jgi:outer membrane immunogenic protein
MKKLLLGAFVVTVLNFAGPASAADLAARPYTKAPPMPVAAVYNWTGFYIGANGGWGSSHKCWDFTTPAGVFVANEGCHDATGAVAGGQIGYRWQASNWVFGVEAQGDWADLKGSNTSLVFAPFVNASRIRAFGLFTGQLGYAWNNVLLYVKGGAAVTADRFHVDTAIGGVLAATAGSDNRWGGAVGAGLEFGFAPGWSAAIEYDHLFMQDRLITFTDTTGAFFSTDRIHQDVDLVTARINYRFGGPVVAKY